MPHILLSIGLSVAAFPVPLYPSVPTVAAAQTPAVANVSERDRGIELVKQEKFEDASAILRKVVDKNKADAESWYFLGVAFVRQEKEAKNASKAFETALKIRPDFTAARAGWSYALLIRSKFSDAIREARAVVKIDPELRDAHYVLAVANLRNGSRDEALKEAEIIIKLSPQFALGYLLKSQALVAFAGDVLKQTEDETSESRKNRFRESAEALEKYLQLEPNSRDKAALTEQLESLRFYLTSRKGSSGDDRTYSGSEVTTKARVIKKPEPEYTDSARKSQVMGKVVLRAIFAADGKVKYILIIKDLPNGLTEEAVRAARRIKFIPATINGRPVSMFVQLEYNFGLF